MALESNSPDTDPDIGPQSPLGANPSVDAKSTLRSLSILAFLWGSGGAVTKLVVQVGAQVVLARILGPAQYGLFAVGVIILSFSNYFSDLGIAYGLIQKAVVKADHVRFVFTWQLITGSIVSIALMLLAPVLANFFHAEEIRYIVYALAPICTLQAASAVSMNLLQRDLNYKAVQIAQVVGYFIGYVAVGIPMALHGFQVWSLVWAWGAQVITTLLILYSFCRHPIGLKLTHPESADMTSFGLKVLLTNLINWAASNIDRVVVARYLPSASVGLYTTSYNLMYTPALTATSVVQPVLYSTCARMQGDAAGIRSAYLTSVAGICASLLPVYLFVAAISETFVLSLYGPAWIAAAPLLIPVALCMPFLLLWNLTTPPLWTSGRITSEVKLQTPIAILWLACTLVAVRYSVLAVAWTVLGLFILRFCLFVVLLSRVIELGMKDYWRAMQGGVVMAFAVAVTGFVTDRLLHAAGLDIAILRLIPAVAAGVMVALLLVRLFPTTLYPSLFSAISDTLHKVSPSLCNLFVKYAGARQ